MTVQLALYKGKGQIGNAAIRWWTGSQYSHCELVIDDRCYSSSVMDGGVRCKAVGSGKDQISLKPEHWDLVPLPWADAGKIIRYFARTEHYRYGWVSLITSQILNRNMSIPSTSFCSQWCAAALGVPDTAIYSPNSFGNLSRYINTLQV